MLKFGVADYGMNVWFGANYDYERRLEKLKAIGYDGIERLSPLDADDAMRQLTALARLGMDFATCETKNPERNIKWTAALGKTYVWADKSAYIPMDFDAYCRTVRYQCETCAEFGIKAAVHNHLGSLVETQEQLDAFMEACPDAGLLLDTGHLGGAGGDVMKTVDKYYDRIVAVHLKDWQMTNPDGAEWYQRGYFTGLGHGNFPIDNKGVVQYLMSRGYDKWIFIEEDTHKQDPYLDLAENRETLDKWING